MIPRRFRASRLSAAFVLYAAIACRAPWAHAVEIGPSAATRLSQETVAGVTVVLRVTPLSVAPGDTVRFTATATNATDRRVQIGAQCGPSMDVLVALPAGAARSVLGGRAFACVLLPEHFVEPRSARSQELHWVAPAVPGEYSARAGLRRGDGLGNLSESIRFVVR